ncbi:FadR/GntR family transcriptional regulator [Paenibacillus senegalimassiliensis]|uniref:FadR/GntR family transcriptional regulator n=1 Tax=Paenibacillus senegalimassiliensis TaxID=1737426 RepID=UPI00073E9E6D|nr:FCD domain-containing protein [Paenibacillus senegalimassiliensis]
MNGCGAVSLNLPVQFEKVSSKKISDFIFGQLEEAIILKELKSDEQIPSERDLAVIFGASRLAVREALAQLEELGLVEKRVGAKGGTFILPLTLNSHRRNREELIRNWDALMEVFEYRTIVEPQAAHLAARKITDEELHRLREYIEASTDPACTRETFRALDVQIHLSVAKASGNAYLYRSIRQIRTKINPALDLMPYNETIRSHNNEEHQALYQALSRRDAEASRDIMCRHISQSAEAISSRMFEEQGDIPSTLDSAPTSRL